MKEYVFKTNKEIKGCGDCPLVAINKLYDYRDGKMHKHIYCCLNHNIRFPNGVSDELENRRHSNCPLVELPEPHGELMDKNRFIETIKHEYEPDFLCANDVELLFNLLKDEAPTIMEASE